VRARGAWRAAWGAALLALAACDTGGPARVATVSQIRGQAFACRDSFPADLTACPPAAVGGEVGVNGGVGTGAGDSALVMQSGSVAFRLEPQSALKYVANQGAAASFLLSAGRIFASHESGAETVVIRSGNVAVAELGTVYTVATNSSGVIVSVLSGSVAVEVPPGSNQKQTVRAGEGVQVPPGATAPPPAHPMTPAEQRVWRQAGANPPTPP
jgi:ferric-dicitrate binding protein FerR (iron transport regulator)